MVLGRPACATVSTAVPTRHGTDSGRPSSPSVSNMRGFMAAASTYSR
jgi:hypothetical protein